MALVYASAGTAAAASGTSPTTVATTVALAVGDVLVVAMAYDNSGTSGADPLTAFAAAPATGAMTVVSTQVGLNDPGAASAGVAARVNAYRVTTAISSGTNISISWTGTLVVRAIVLTKVNSNTAGALASYRTNNGAAAFPVVASAAPALTTPSVTNTELVLCWAAHENGANITGDADTTSGSWGTIITTFNGTTATGIAMGVQGKTVTATATQTFNPTGTSSDWILGALIFTEAPPTVALSTLIDSFDAAPISTTLWPEATSAVWDATGRAKITVDTAYSSILQTNSVGTYTLTGSGIYLKLVLPTMGGTSIPEMLLELVPPGGSPNNRLYIRVGDNPATIQARKVDAAVYTTVGTDVAYSPTTHTWIRITESGGTLTYATSADGLSWNTTGTTSIPSWAITRVYVRISGGSTTAAVGDAFVDNVNIVPTATGRPKVYSGTVWAQKPLKVWTGAAWVQKPVKVWTGSAWRILS